MTEKRNHHKKLSAGKIILLYRFPLKKKFLPENFPEFPNSDGKFSGNSGLNLNFLINCLAKFSIYERLTVFIIKLFSNCFWKNLTIYLCRRDSFVL